ncbi:MAG: creatininase family protein [Muribaculaceae bacterium]|nr:creatininase family protein [Muribaculaceae bacterium]
MTAIQNQNSHNDLSTATYGQTRHRDYDMAILPWGATEPHNLHLPYLTDCILSHAVAADAADAAHEKYGIECMVLPPVAMGAQNPGQRDLKFCIHYRYETQKAILTDIVLSLHHQGLRRLLIVNGHGGNSFKPMIRDLAVDFPDMTIAVSDWFTVLPARDWFERPGDHADELETSVMMHYHPGLVDLSTAGSGASRPFAAESLQRKTAWIPRHWLKVSDDTGIGDPSLSTAEKGAAYVSAVAGLYADLIRDLVRGPIYS